jgi:F-type H+-transporting ATPase subunit delta
VSRSADLKVAKRYARALFNAAQKIGSLEAVQNDLTLMDTLWRQTPALPRLLESPLVPAEKKRELLDKTLSGQLNAATRAFLYLLIEKRREEILPAVHEEFLRLADDAAGLIRAQATVALPLDESERAALLAGLQQRTGKRIELQVNVDPAILGGVVVRMKDTVIDGSVRGALERLREQMLHERL